MSYTKQVIVIRKDLNMRKGKMVSQGAHASMAFLSRGIRDILLDWTINGKITYAKPDISDEALEWLNTSFTKITVGVDSEQELLAIHQKAQEAGITSCLIEDKGLTEFNGIPTKTAIAIGPDYSEKIDEITGHLKLL